MDISQDLKAADSLYLAEEAVKLMLEKKAIDVKMFCVKDYTSVTDYYVNVTGRSSTHVASLADDLCDNFSLRGLKAHQVEGRRGNSWLLVDFGFLIVNVFDSESRSFYNFDRLLPAEGMIDISGLVEEVDKKFS